MKFAMMSFIVAQGITADGAQSIADALYLHPSITELILAHNVLADQGRPPKSQHLQNMLSEEELMDCIMHKKARQLILECCTFKTMGAGMRFTLDLFTTSAEPVKSSNHAEMCLLTFQNSA